jgi:hypothetical protein
VEAINTGGQGSRRAVVPSDDDKVLYKSKRIISRVPRYGGQTPLHPRTSLILICWDILSTSKYTTYNELSRVSVRGACPWKVNPVHKKDPHPILRSSVTHCLQQKCKTVNFCLPRKCLEEWRFSSTYSRRSY